MGDEIGGSEGRIRDGEMVEMGGKDLGAEKLLVRLEARRRQDPRPLGMVMVVGHRSVGSGQGPPPAITGMSAGCSACSCG